MEDIVSLKALLCDQIIFHALELLQIHALMEVMGVRIYVIMQFRKSKLVLHLVFVDCHQVLYCDIVRITRRVGGVMVSIETVGFAATVISVF